jgi:predicted ABC-class ATPase
MPESKASPPTPPLDREALTALLRSLDARGYRAYKRLAGRYAFGRFVLVVDHVQGDPFSDPSRLRVLVDPSDARLPAAAFTSEAGRTASADFLNRTLLLSIGRRSRSLGSGRSGELTVLRPGQEVLRRTAVTVDEGGGIEARFRAGLPARGRTVIAPEATELLSRLVPEAVEESMLPGGRDDDALMQHVRVVEDARALRDQLGPRRLIAFVADGSLLPRSSGVDDRPLPSHVAVSFRSPDSLRVTLGTPHSGEVSGMGVPEGITLLVGGGYHGKSTLLRAIERGVYDHAPGDGRERVVTRADAVKVRAEDGRSVAGTDISAFIRTLPGGVRTDRFYTANASGSTSQAAGIAEALETGCRALLLDEDTSATNLLIRDARVRALITADAEPIVPLADRIGGLRASGISFVMVVGGSGAYFDVADTVVAMREYEAREVTEEAKRIAGELPLVGLDAQGSAWSPPAPRPFQPERIRPERGPREVEVRAFSPRRLTIGTEEIDLAGVEQLVEAAQARAIGMALAWARNRVAGGGSLDEAMRQVMDTMGDSLDAIDDRLLGEYAAFRRAELAAVFSRLRGD